MRPKALAKDIAQSRELEKIPANVENLTLYSLFGKPVKIPAINN